MYKVPSTKYNIFLSLNLTFEVFKTSKVLDLDFKTSKVLDFIKTSKVRKKPSRLEKTFEVFNA